MFFFTGCGKEPLAPNQIRAITRELVFAAHNATDGKAEVGMRPESQPTQAARGASGRAGTTAPAADHLYVTLPAGGRGRPDPAVLRALEAELDRVARYHGLERVDRPGGPGVTRFDYRLGNQRTHTIDIITPTVPRPTAAQSARARLAIIIDDLGYDRAPAEALFTLAYPLTISVLPHLPYSADIAEEAHRRGYQVLLHLPVESNGDSKAEAIELRRGMGAAEVDQLLGRMLDTVPHAVGVNNHQGSLGTADPALMSEVMTALRARDLFFVDSRTTTATVAYDAALRARVPAAYRNVFLDDMQTVDAVHAQLIRAVRDARQNGFAIAIGHPHPATLQALAEDLPQLESHGIGLVFASDLVR